MKLIPLTQGQFAKVSDEDYEYCMRFKWRTHTQSNRNTKYALRNLTLSISPTKQCNVQMHREILLLKKGDKAHVDHINGDGLDNRRENLRLCTMSQNNRNRNPNKGSKWKGTFYKKYKIERKWASGLKFDGKNIHLGYFNTEKEAALAYDEGAKKYFGEFARTNF